LAYGIGGATLASSVIGAASSTLGLMGNINILSAGAGLTGLVSHFVTCGAALFPTGLAAFMGSKKDKPIPQAAPVPWSQRVSLELPTPLHQR
jgi:hypothetical protein